MDVIRPRAFKAAPCAAGHSLQASTRNRVRPAVMTVAMPTDDDDEAAAAGVALVIKLWRADMLAGTLDLGPSMTVVKADATMALVLGCPVSRLVGKNLAQ